MTLLLAFYFGSHPDHCGRMLAEVVKQDDDWLETSHDYIQWLFPLTEHSRVVPNAPTLSVNDIKVFTADDLLKQHMLIALRRMLQFYGLIDFPEIIAKGPNWQNRKGNWFTEQTHNSLRITRILKSLMLLGHEVHAKRFQRCLDELCSKESDCGVSKESQLYWQQAVKQRSSSAA